MASGFTFGPQPPAPAAEEKAPEEKKPAGPALLWGEDTELDPDNPDYAALMSLKEDLTPDERAEGLKEQGNECLKRKRPFYYREAVKCYTRALDENTGHAEHNAVYYSNRAHAHLLLGNHAKALADATAAIALNAENVKAYYRAAKAAIALRRYDEALSCSQEGLKRDPENAEMSGFLRTATKEIALESLRKMRVTQAEQEADAMLAGFRQKRLRFGRTQFGSAAAPPWLDQQGRMHFRVLLLYPESMQMDTIEDVCETDPLSLHLDEMFSPAAPPLSWDQEGAYTRQNIRLIAEIGHRAWSEARVRTWLLEGSPAAGAGDAPVEEPLDRADEIERVVIPETKTLRDVLTHPGYTIPGLPVFLVVPRGGMFEKIVLSGKWKVPM